MTATEWSAIALSLQVALWAVAISLPPGMWVGWLLARKKFNGKLLVEILVFLPLVLPPVVTGYLLLLLFGRQGWVGEWLFNTFNISFLFNTKAMVLASALVGFPLLVRSIRAIMESIPRGLEAAARTLGCSKLSTFISITLPLALPGIVSGCVLSFARALGEFGATRMVALNTDGTRTLALEIFQLIETPGTPAPVIVRLTVVSIVLSAAALLVCEILARRWKAAAP